MKKKISVEVKNDLQKDKSNSWALMSRIKRINIDTVCVCVFTVLAVFAFAQVFYHIIKYELSHAYSVDSPLYWTVGRGMMNGLTPYSDLYENKPIGIFVLSVISFFFTDSTIICNIVSIISAFIIAVVPSLFLLQKCIKGAANKDEKLDSYDIFSFLIVIMCGTMLAVYSESYSGGFQVEAIGAACSILYIYSARKLMAAEDKKRRIIRTILTAMYISFAVMLKEPFLLAATAGVLLFTNSFKDFIKGVIIPDIIGGIATLTILGVTGILKPYFTIYIKNMLNTRMSSGEPQLNNGDSAFKRALNILFLKDDLKCFDSFLWMIIFLALIITLASVYKKSIYQIIFQGIKVIAVILTASFCVGLGSQYFDHHYIFAVPVYAAFIMYSGEHISLFKGRKKFVKSAIMICCFLLISDVALNYRKDYEGDSNDKYKTMVAKAQYVDKLMDFYGEERYQYIGLGDFLGLTKHSPMGPFFVQDSCYFQTEDTFFKQFLEQIDKSNIVIFNYYTTPLLNRVVKNILEEDFTTEPPKENDLEKPSDFYYTVYYRKGM